MDLIKPSSEVWRPQVLTASALTGEGVPEIWEAVLAHREQVQASGELERKRRSQARDWMWALVDEGLLAAFRAHPGVRARIEGLESAVEALETTPAAAARVLLEAFDES